MKRYIRASFDSSIPNWLRYAISRNISDIKDCLYSKYRNRIAFNKAKVSTTPIGDNSTPIYKLTDDYGKLQVYIPGVNDNFHASINNENLYRTPTFSEIGIDTIESIAEDIVYIDLSDESNKYTPREKYQDPRYNYKYNNHGDYSGQAYSDLDEKAKIGRASCRERV